jgi:hypothetical protein
MNCERCGRMADRVAYFSDARGAGLGAREGYFNCLTWFFTLTVCWRCHFVVRRLMRMVNARRARAAGGGW